MGKISLNVGDPITLDLKLTDSLNPGTKFVRAILRDEDGTQLTGSPVTLTHIGENLFVDDSINYPVGVVEVHATYQVFLDAGFTVPSQDDGEALDVYRVDPLLAAIDAAIDDLVNAGRTGDLVAEILDADELEAVVDDC